MNFQELPEIRLTEKIPEGTVRLPLKIIVLPESPRLILEFSVSITKNPVMTNASRVPVGRMKIGAPVNSTSEESSPMIRFQLKGIRLPVWTTVWKLKFTIYGCKKKISRK